MIVTTKRILLLDPTEFSLADSQFAALLGTVRPNSHILVDFRVL